MNMDVQQKTVRLLIVESDSKMQEDFNSFLADFLENFVVPHVEQIICIRALDGVTLPVFDDGIQFVKYKR